MILFYNNIFILTINFNQHKNKEQYIQMYHSLFLCSLFWLNYSSHFFLIANKIMIIETPNTRCPIPAIPEIAASIPWESVSAAVTCNTPLIRSMIAVRFKPTWYPITARFVFWSMKWIFFSIRPSTRKNIIPRIK